MRYDKHNLLLLATTSIGIIVTYYAVVLYGKQSRKVLCYLKSFAPLRCRDRCFCRGELKNGDYRRVRRAKNGSWAFLRVPSASSAVGWNTLSRRRRARAN